MTASASTPPAAVSDHGEFVAADAAAHRLLRQRFLQALRNRADQLVAAQHAEMRGDVFHAIEVDERESRHLIVLPLGQCEVEQFERLGVIGQTGKLVLVAGATGSFFGEIELAARPRQMEQGKARQGNERERRRCQTRHHPGHGLHHRPRPFPGEEPDDTALRVGDRLLLAAARLRFTFELETLKPAALLDHAHKARVELVTLAKYRTKLGDGRAQRGALFRQETRIALARDLIGERRPERRHAERNSREHDDSPARRRPDTSC